MRAALSDQPSPLWRPCLDSVRFARATLAAALERPASGVPSEPLMPPRAGAADNDSSPLRPSDAGSVAAPQLLLSVPEAARALGIARSTLYVLLDRRELLSVSIGHRRLLPASALEDYVERLIQRAHAEQARSRGRGEGQATRARERGERWGRSWG